MSKSEQRQLKAVPKEATRNALNLIKEIKTFAPYTSKSIYIKSIKRPSQCYNDLGHIELGKNYLTKNGDIAIYKTTMKFGKFNDNSWYSGNKLSFAYSFGESYDNPKHVKKPYKALQVAEERLNDKIRHAKALEHRNVKRAYKRKSLIDAFSLQEQYSQPDVNHKLAQLHEPKLIFHFPRCEKVDVYNREWAIEVEDPNLTHNQVQFAIRFEDYSSRRAHHYRNLTEEKLFGILNQELERRIKYLGHEQSNLRTFCHNNIEIDDYSYKNIRDKSGHDGRFAYTKLELNSLKHLGLHCWDRDDEPKTVILDPVKEKEVA